MLISTTTILFSRQMYNHTLSAPCMRSVNIYPRFFPWHFISRFLVPRLSGNCTRMTCFSYTDWLQIKEHGLVDRVARHGSHVRSFDLGGVFCAIVCSDLLTRCYGMIWAGAGLIGTAWPRRRMSTVCGSFSPRCPTCMSVCNEHTCYKTPVSIYIVQLHV